MSLGLVQLLNWNLGPLQATCKIKTNHKKIFKLIWYNFQSVRNKNNFGIGRYRKDKWLTFTCWQMEKDKKIIVSFMLLFFYIVIVSQLYTSQNYEVFMIRYKGLTSVKALRWKYLLLIFQMLFHPIFKMTP